MNQFVGLSKVFVWLFALFLSWNVMSSQAEAAVYESPEGLKIFSDAPAWDSKEKLQQVYQELLKNTHSEEFKLLTEIEIHADYPKGQGVAGEYRFQAATDLIGRKKMLPGRIDLYGGSERTTVESLAKTLAHEYGHHVTHYYSLKQDGFSLTDTSMWQKSTYAKIRGLSSNPKVNQLKEHRWQIGEIAAEDYVQLFGSPTAKKVHLFPSRFEALRKGKEIGPVRWDASMYNVIPQENQELPLAAKVPGLYEWFAGNLKTDKKPQIPAQPNLKVKEVKKEGEAGYQILFEWADGSKIAPGNTYTLVAYGEEDFLPEPIVTRQSGESMQARYGTIVVRSPMSILTYSDPNAKGVKNFRVYVQNELGFAASSQILSINMEQPDKVTIKELETVNAEQASSQPLSIQDLKLSLFDFSTWEEMILQGITQTVHFASQVLEQALRILN